MQNLIQAALNQAALQGFLNTSGRLVTRVVIYFKPPFSSRPEKRGAKGGLNPHVYWPQAALTKPTSYRRTAL